MPKPSCPDPFKTDAGFVSKDPGGGVAAATPSSASERIQPSPRFLERIPRDFARDHLILSEGVDEERGAERLIVSESSDQCAVHNTGAILERPISTRIMPRERIAAAIDDAYARVNRNGRDSEYFNDPASESEVDDSIRDSDLDRLIAEADKDLLSTHGKAPIVRLVDAILFDALQRSASDVHFQPLPATTLVRYRLDGVLHTVRQISLNLTNSVISRIKVMGRMDIAERRVPQDGRATVTIGAPGSKQFPPVDRSPGDLTNASIIASRTNPAKNLPLTTTHRAIDLRISTIPTSYGERAVIRLLDNSQQLCDLEKIGMPPEVVRRYLDRAARSNGIILVTGPTGSGKTTTLYSTLRHIGSAATNIMTIEDPIEYELSSLGGGLAISQSQVNLRKGVTFATGLRHILRQDPDVVMVGEIRDEETARIAIQSSLTGHLVFSTLHTNDAASAVTRLIDLGVECYLVSASLSAVLAQRLVRTIHGTCEGNGCAACLDTGFRGRTGVFELIVVDEPMRELISAGAPLRAIREAAKSNGTLSLAEDGKRLLASGRTSREELDRVVWGAV